MACLVILGNRLLTATKVVSIARRRVSTSDGCGLIHVASSIEYTAMARVRKTSARLTHSGQLSDRDLVRRNSETARCHAFITPLGSLASAFLAGSRDISCFLVTIKISLGSNIFVGRGRGATVEYSRQLISFPDNIGLDAHLPEVIG